MRQPSAQISMLELSLEAIDEGLHPLSQRFRIIRLRASGQGSSSRVCRRTTIPLAGVQGHKERRTLSTGGLKGSPQYLSLERL